MVISQKGGPRRKERPKEGITHKKSITAGRTMRIWPFNASAGNITDFAS
jgi:hypothetical protein